MINDDAWRYIHYVTMDSNQKAEPLEIVLPRAETVVGFALVPNPTYYFPTQLCLTFDDSDRHVDLTLEPVHRRQDFEIPAITAKKVTLDIREVAPGENAGPGKPTGIDNLWITVQRPDTWKQRVRPLLNIGGLVKYRMGPGGIILNQLNIKDQEAVPVNREKKQAIVTTLLRNLHADFPGARTVVPGQGLRYTPVSLENHCNTYLTTERGWPYGQLRNADFSHLPLGRQTFGGVTYQIRDFRTSPLESAITVGNQWRVRMPLAVEGIPVNRKADALFFLHTVDLSGQGERWVRDERMQQREPALILTYRIHYAGGRTVDVPVYLNQAIAHWIQTEPRSLKEAAVAWAAPFDNEPTPGQATLYSMQWNNPHAGDTITALDILVGDRNGRWGTPVIMAVTTAEVIGGTVNK